MTLRLAIVGLGKIARDQHVAAIAATEGVELVAVASRNASLPGLPSFRTIDDLIASGTGFDAVALCTPPEGRFAQARAAILSGRHVFLEKPPGATLAEIGILRQLAAEKGVTLFTSWHSRCAACVTQARDFLVAHAPSAMHIDWKEDVRQWHPGQDWIWEPGGFGVFDPGINALSILTAIVPERVILTTADLHFPANKEAPIAADLVFRGERGLPVTATFDWRQTGLQSWDITAETERGQLVLSKGGAALSLNGKTIGGGEDVEYRGLYARFRKLVQARRSEVDTEPLVHIADAFMLGRRHTVAAFEESVS